MTQIWKQTIYREHLNAHHSAGLFTFFLQDYCASKFGAVGFHESLTHELRAEDQYGIKTTLVCPYIVDTGMFAGCEIRWDATIHHFVTFVVVRCDKNSCCILHSLISTRKELRSLIPPLEPLYTVQQSMKAILGEQQMICIPRLMYIPLLTRAWVLIRLFIKHAA